jgi:hypothetical protein
LDQLRSNAKGEHLEIIELCALAGDETQAVGFIREGKSVADVRKALLEKRAAKTDEKPVQNGVLSHEAAAAAGAAPKKSTAQVMKERLGIKEGK